MNNIFKRKKKGKLKRSCSLLLSAAMVLNTLSFDGTTVFASEEQETESYGMEVPEEGSSTKMQETDAEEPEKEEISTEWRTEEKQTEEQTVKKETTEEATEEKPTKEETTEEEISTEEPEKEEISTEWRTEEKQTEEQTTQEATEEIISEEMTETEDSEEEQVQDNLGASSYTVYRDCDKNNVQKGTATVLIRGRNAYSGVKSITFNITAADNQSIWSGLFSIFKS